MLVAGLDSRSQEHADGDFTSPPDRRYRFAVIDWYDLVDNEMFSINEYDSLLEDLGFKDGEILFSYFRILGKSLDEGLAPLMSGEDVLSLLKYVPRYREFEDDDVETKTEASTSKVATLVEGDNESIYVFSESDPTGHPPWSSESMNEKRINGRDPIKKVEHMMEEPVHYEFNGLMYGTDDDHNISGIERDLETWNDDNNLLQQEDLVIWQQDPYHGDDDEEEFVELFAELDQLIEHVAFLNVKLRESMVGVDALVVDVNASVVHVDASVIALEELLERVEHVVDEEIERPKKRKRENEDESASGNVPFGRLNNRRRLNPAKTAEKAMEDYGLGFHV
ncbi:hypothetical protein Tco_1506703 [Tanacetum coccineum]